MSIVDIEHHQALHHNVKVVGPDGYDLLNSGGKDVMSGGGGRDLILGGRGKDEMTGNGGADVFQFTRGNGRDTITDFRQGVDRIEIAEDGFDFSALNISQKGADVMIAFANTHITVLSDDVEDFTATDFLF